MTNPSPAPTMRERTIWTTREVSAPIRAFLRTESGSSGVLLAAIAAGLIWANADDHSYELVWHTVYSVRLGHWGITRDLRTWINSGLMTLFFLVVGLEARREFDLGDLRERRRFLLPMLAGLIGMVIPVAIYLAFNAGRHDGSAAHAWGVSMSTDTALALGLLTLVGRGVPDRVRIFLLTVFVVDDLAALVTIAVAYSRHLSLGPLSVAIVTFAVLLTVKLTGVLERPSLYAVLGVVVWAALLGSGIDPVVAGLAIGLTAPAYTPAREKLERATTLFRRFREQPTAELARDAVSGLTATVSPNARLQRFYHPWTSYLIVPLFGLANSGIVISGSFLAHAYTAPITLGVLVGYVVGKPVAVVGTSWLLQRVSRGRIRPAVGWAAVGGAGSIAGIGFTVSFLIASLALTGRDLAEAKLGVLTAGVLASGLTAVIFWTTRRLSPARRAKAILGDVDLLVDLIEPVDEERDHIRGPADASVTVVEYGDFQCPYCGMAESAVREQLQLDGDVRYVWRHLPLTDVHPQAQQAAEASEAAAARGRFWEMHDRLLTRQEHLREPELVAYAIEEGLDGAAVRDELKRRVYRDRVAADVESADLSGVSGTPTFFINGQRHYGAYDAGSLAEAVKLARVRAKVRAHATAATLTGAGPEADEPELTLANEPDPEAEPTR